MGKFLLSFLNTLLIVKSKYYTNSSYKPLYYIHIYIYASNLKEKKQNTHFKIYGKAVQITAFWNIGLRLIQCSHIIPETFLRRLLNVIMDMYKTSFVYSGMSKRCLCFYIDVYLF